MSTLNKIYYGSAGTGKTREATREAVNIISKSNGFNFKIEDSTYPQILETFKSYATLPKIDVTDKKLLQDIQNPNINIEKKEYLGYSKQDLNNMKDDVAEYRKKFMSYPLVETVTFHPSYSYQDFVEGITIDTEETQKNTETVKDIIYTVKDGIFKKICEKARNNKSKGYNYVLIIDEINRGDISSIFGELFTLLEDNRREGESEELSINLPYSKDVDGNPKKLTVPSNLYIVATMNTVDKSIALIDVALRRRFDFIEMKPEPELLKDIKIEDINLLAMLEAINNRITILKNEHYQIGHSYFLKIETFDDLKRVMTKNIIPLLQEYFYDDWKSICAVLNQPYEKSNNENGLFDIKKADDKMFSAEFKDLIEFNNKKIVTIRDFDAQDIKTIY